MQLFSDSLLFFPLIILVGLCLGSFVTAAASRIPERRNLVLSRSKCPECRHRLGMPDLVPIFSWLCLRGKCSHCRHPIPWRYPAIELASALIFTLPFIIQGVSLPALLLALLGIALLTMTIIDLEHLIIPDSIQLVLVIISTAYGLAIGTPPLHMLLGALAMGLLAFSLRFLMQWWKRKEGLGMGDVKFFIISGITLDIVLLIPFLFISGMLGCILAIIWRLAGRGERFPFGPALGAALYLSLLSPEMWQTGMIMLSTSIAPVIASGYGS